MSEYDHEPIPGLPERLPAGEHILWQGSPDWLGLAKGAFHVQGIAVYFVALLLWALSSGSMIGIGLTLAGACVGLSLLFGLAWLSARTTIYTITNKRVVLRFGMALQKCVNLPLTAIGSAGLALDGAGRGNIVLQLSARHRLGYLQFWPHARAWKLARPEPMLRAVPNALHVTGLLSTALRAANPGSQTTPLDVQVAAQGNRKALTA
ncbi:photosynthetic complex putative assembly protein PuhB [Aquisediminimonas profunda]|uniref:photosynthetic complex putative assembly protein PuhB n=1 Tax=Aquisediminimonas profunda TaxID=1550733 RepID=UPI001C62B173|nr:photosynthetic complex putative assembly protein PuhB [Aquisediminimonas profunda]